MSRTIPLREELKRRFFPFVADRGFVLDDSCAPRLYTFRRLGPQKMDVFDITWDKHLRPMFVLGFNDAPIGGVTVRGTHIPASHINPQDPSFRLALCRRRGPSTRSWFQLRKPLLERLMTWEAEYGHAQVIDQVLAAYPEMEAWWESGVIGPHIWAPLDAEGGFRISKRMSNKRLERAADG
jgi:hypothetical protein